jgi:hypothetical protein
MQTPPQKFQKLKCPGAPKRKRIISKDPKPFAPKDFLFVDGNQRTAEQIFEDFQALVSINRSLRFTK